jgi:sirohydrochlorin ferrochelatase
MTGFIVFAHGSRVESANEAVRAVSAQLAAAGPHSVEPAFLELGEPDLAGAVARLAQRGANRIVVLPYFLTLGTHMQRDLPKLVEAAAAHHGHLDITIAPPLDGHPALVDVLLDRAASALEGGSL